MSGRKKWARKEKTIKKKVWNEKEILKKERPKMKNEKENEEFLEIKNARKEKWIRKKVMKKRPRRKKNNYERKWKALNGNGKK